MRLALDQSLQTGQALKFRCARRVVCEIRCRRSRARTVKERERVVEADFRSDFHRRFEIERGFARKTDNEIGRDRYPGACRTQAADDGFVFKSRIAALHRCEYA